VAPGGECCYNSELNPFVCGAGGHCCGNACMDDGSKCCEAKNGYKFPASLLTTCEEATPPLARPASPGHKRRSLIETEQKQESKESCAHGWKECGGFCMPEASDCCPGLAGVYYQCAPIVGGSACCGGGCLSPGGTCCNNETGSWEVDKAPYPVAPETKCEAQLTVPCYDIIFGTNTTCAEGSTCCEGLCVAPGGECCYNSELNPFVCGAGGHCCGNACMDDGSKCCEAKNGYKYPASLLTTCEEAAPPLLRPASRGHKHFSLIEKDEPKTAETDAPKAAELDAELGIVYPTDDTPLQSVGDIISRGWANACPSHGKILHCPLGLTCCHGTCISKFSICCENVPGNGFGCGSDGSSCCGNACAGAGSKCCEHPGNPNADYPVTIATQCRGDIGPPVQCPANSTGGVPFSCGFESTCCGTICAGPGSGCFRNTGGNFYVCSPGSLQCGDACAAPGNHCCSFGGAQWPVAKAQDCPKGSTRLFTV